MKKIACKTLYIMLIIVIILNFLCSTSYAENETTNEAKYDDPTSNVTGADAAAIEQENQAMQEGSGILGTLLDGIVGILLYLPKLQALGVGLAAQVVTGGMVKASGVDENFAESIFITPEVILFNRAAIVDINFFTDTYADGVPLPANSPIRIIRESIAKWYYALRNLAIIILLCILIYVGIKMAISSVAEEQAKYKNMLIDWVVSFVLIFMLQYIILITINANNALVKILYNSIGDAGESSLLFQNVTAALVTKALSPLATVGIGATLVYIGVIVMTIAFLIMYIKRMITIAFLILIAPIITVTYSLDKMKDRTAQALNTWLKEFIYNVIIQPFHCILYLVFVLTAVKLLNGTLAGMIFALLMMFFIFQAEDIIKKIFGLGAASSLGKMAGSMATVYGGFKLLQSGAGKVAGGAKGVAAKASGGKGGNKVPMKSAPKTSGGNKGSSSGNSSSGGGNRSSSGGNKSSSSGGGSSSGKKRSSSGKGSFGKRAISGIKKFPGNAARFVWNTNKNMASAGVAGMLIGGMIGGMAQGSFLGMAAGGAAGMAVNKSVNTKIQGIKQTGRIKTQERMLASLYNNYQTNGGYDNQTMDGITDAMINMGSDKLDRIKDVNERALAQSLHSMMQTYEKTGHDDPQESIKDTLAAIQAGKIKPKTK